MNAKTLWLATRETFKKFIRDEPFQKAAAVSYFALLSLTPLLLIAVAIAGLLYGEKAASGHLAADLEALMGSEAAFTIQTILKHGSTPEKGLVSVILGIFMLFFGATGVFGQLRVSLNQIFKTAKGNRQNAFLNFIMGKLLLVAMVIGVGFLLLISLTMAAILPVVGTYFQPHVPGSVFIWQVFNIIFSLTFISMALALLFKYLPYARLPWSDVLFGSVVTAVLFTIGNVLIGVYLGQAGIGSTFGAAGSIMILMVWIYYNALIIFFGAELIQVFGHFKNS